jgi:hypothetical protein
VFDGYVFVETTKSPGEIASLLSGMSYMIRLLRSNADIVKLSEPECELIQLWYGSER